MWIKQLISQSSAHILVPQVNSLLTCNNTHLSGIHIQIRIEIICEPTVGLACQWILVSFAIQCLSCFMLTNSQMWRTYSIKEMPQGWKCRTLGILMPLETLSFYSCRNPVLVCVSRSAQLYKKCLKVGIFQGILVLLSANSQVKGDFWHTVALFLVL